MFQMLAEASFIEEIGDNLFTLFTGVVLGLLTATLAVGFAFWKGWIKKG